MHKKLPLPKLKKKLWRIFSEYIRRKDADSQGFVSCFTCGKIDHYKNMDAGHYFPAGSSGLTLYFDERNVHPQCTGCNRFRHGNIAEYSFNLVRKYGIDIIEELRSLKDFGKWSRYDYEKLIEFYKEKIAKINKTSNE